MGFKIILADKNNPDHTRAIQRLWDDNLHSIAEGRYEWLYQGNPAGETITCLAVHKETDTVVGIASAMRRNFYLNGSCYTAGVAIDFAIDAEHRVFGPALQLQRALVDQAWAQGLEFMLGFPNPASQGVVIRVGYERFGENLRFSQLIRTHSKLVSELNARHFPVWLARPAAAILDTGLVLRNLLGSSSGTSKVFTSVDELDAQCQRMWKKNIAAEGFQGEHSADYISWRYMHCPSKDYRVFGLFDKKQDLVAYLVYVVGDELLVIDDMRYLDRKWVPSLFRQFWKAARSMDNLSISAALVVSGNIREMMVKSGFIPRPSDRWGAVLSNPASSRNWKEALSSGDWYITDGEVDL